MADILTSNLYPPIIDSFMPAFIINEENQTCKVKFMLPDTDNISDINTDAVQVILKNQKNNHNSLKARAGIVLKTMYQDSEIEGGWYIELNPNDLIDGQFYIDQLYKLQLRFTGLEATVTTSSEPSASWFSDNLDKFSEWSTVCLLKRISEPYIQLQSLVQNVGEDVIYCNSAFLNLNENLKFTNSNEDEYLSYYSVELYKNNTLVEESNIIYNSEDTFVNKIKYRFKYLLASMENQLEEDYTVKIYITTNNLYTQVFSYDFIASAVEGVGVDAAFDIAPEPDQGRIRVGITFNNQDGIPTYGIDDIPLNHMIIYRSSNKNKTVAGLIEWDEIASIALKNSDFNSGNPKLLVFYDSSVESGIFYRYAIRLVDNNGNLGTPVILDVIEIPNGNQTITNPNYYVCDYEDMFLNSQFRQLKMRYDSRVTSYKRTVLENKIETIGSRFPFIRRNSATNYKQFSINGLITFHTDDAKIFLSDKEIYGGHTGITNRYNIYNTTHGINPYNDYTKEREFREKVIDFLNAGEPILLRTMTEGNVLVRFMDINITPNQNLNNYICNFTATAIEIAEANFDNYFKYNIFKYTASAERNPNLPSIEEHTHQEG